MDLVTLITVKLTANEVGRDAFGNRYYEERQARPGKPPRRYVRYNGMTEASKVPADWHGWLHHTESSPPPKVAMPGMRGNRTISQTPPGQIMHTGLPDMC